MSYLIKGATIIAIDDAHGADPFAGDIRIEADRIKEIGENLSSDGVGETIALIEKGLAGELVKG